MSTRKPAAARSSSDSPPQKPYSRLSRAHSRHSTSAGHAAQTPRACVSRTARASGRSPAGAKNSRVWPRHAASVVQVRGPVKIRLETASTVICSPPTQGRAREPVGGCRLLEPVSYPPSEVDHKSICQRFVRDRIHLGNRWLDAGRRVGTEGEQQAP